MDARLRTSTVASQGAAPEGLDLRGYLAGFLNPAGSRHYVGPSLGQAQGDRLS